MNKKFFIIGLVLLVLSIAFTFTVTKIDVQPIGPDRTSVGLSTINEKYKVDYNEKVYKISKYLGYVALVIPVVYAGIGVYQLIKGKKLSKVDKRLYMLAIFYCVVLATYVLFEKVVINYRPVVLDDGLEASFPSSHTLMALCFTISAILVNKELFKDKTKLVNCGLFILGMAVAITRLFSGVHWFTDIVGGFLYACSLLLLFKSFVKGK